MGSRIGYARVSSVDQNVDRQLTTLGEVDELFVDRLSGSSLDRPELSAARRYTRAGDTLAVASADRLARDTEHMLTIVREQVAKGVTVEFIKDHLTFHGVSVDERGEVVLDPFAEFQLTLLGAVAKLERSLIRERQREGIAIRKARGGYAKPPALTTEQIDDARRRVADGVPKTVVARDLGIEVRTLYRALNGEGVYSRLRPGNGPSQIPGVVEERLPITDLSTSEPHPLIEKEGTRDERA